MPAIAAAPTSVAAFVGHAENGPIGVPTPIASMADFAASFGETPDATLPQAVDLFFQNGGGRALIVRVADAEPGAEALIGRDGPDASGLGGLEAGPPFNLLVVPDATRPNATGDGTALADADVAQVWRAALDLCRRRRAFLIVDAPPDVVDVASARDWRERRVAAPDPNGACYAPWLQVADPAGGGAIQRVAPSGAVAGLYARTDADRGIWHAPSGVGAELIGVERPVVGFDDAQQAVLNPLGLNLIRAFPGRGVVCWGARTMAGADALASEWKYVPVRRTALFIEESLARGLAWAASEPNGEVLWALIRNAVNGFLDNLFRQRAFAGATPRDAYFVKCDGETTGQADIDRGMVNVVIGFAPLRPAEFVIITLAQMAATP